MEKGNAEKPMAVTATPMSSQQKLGGKCCGGCCDYRRAVIVLGIISIIFSILGVVSPARNTQFELSEYPELEDIIKTNGQRVLIISIVHIVMTVISMVGAIMFNWVMVALYAVWAIIYMVLYIVFEHTMSSDFFDWVDKTLEEDDVTSYAEDWDTIEKFYNIYAYALYGLIVFFTLLWTYPSCFLTAEIKKGIMTRETYPREEFSCCCVARN